MHGDRDSGSDSFAESVSDGDGDGDGGDDNGTAEQLVRNEAATRRVVEARALRELIDVALFHAQGRMLPLHRDSFEELSGALVTLRFSDPAVALGLSDFVEEVVRGLSRWPESAVELAGEVRARQAAQQQAAHSLRVRAALAQSCPPPAPMLPTFDHTRHGFHGRVTTSVATLPSEEDTLQRAVARLPRRLTFVMRGMALEGRLANPLPIPANPGSAYCCDMCNVGDLMVAFQAVFDAQRSAVVFHRDCVGLDVCVACALFHWMRATEEVHSFVAGAAAGSASAAQAVPSHAPLSAISVEGCAFRSPPRAEAAAGTVVISLVVGVAPRGARIAVWEAAAGHGGMPPSDWASHLVVRRRGETPAQAAAAVFGELGDGTGAATCVVCLESLDTCDAACVATRCGHWFHALCLNEALHSQTGRPRCPLCRCEDPLGATSEVGEGESPEDPSAVAAANLHSVELTLVSPPASADAPLRLVVACVLAPGGEGDEATDFGAMRCVSVCALPPASPFLSE